MGTPLRTAAGGLLRCHELRLVTLRERFGEIHREGCGRCAAFPWFCRRSDRMVDDTAKGRGHRCRYLVARSRPVEGFQEPSALAPEWTLGSRKCRQSRKGAGEWRNADRRTRQGGG